MATIDDMLRHMLDAGASDLHMTSGHRPFLRVHGEIMSADAFDVLTPAFNRELLFEIMPEDNRRQFDADWDTDFAYELEGLARFRVNVFVDRLGIGGVLRQIPSRIPTADELGLPKIMRDFCGLSKGLVLVTGPTGSGKSTTLAAMINYINQTRTDHLITIEDPIEFVYTPDRCLINQREVHRHTRSFANALRAALREDPDIVLVGEMRDLETIEIAIETAETGHLVFGTLHTNTAASTVDRIIDKFPADRQNQIRTMLADSLKGVIAQTLCRRKSGGRVGAFEILIITPGVASNIRDGKTHHIPSAMQTGKNLGMQTMNDHLMRLILDGVITPREAYMKSVEREALENKLKEAGIPLDVDTSKLPEIVEHGGLSPERRAELESIAAQAREMLKKDSQNLNALNNLAWICATSVDAGMRNGKEAVKLAERANAISKGQDLQILDTLGAAYAEAGQFAKAIGVANRRLGLAQKAGDNELAESIKGQVRLYESGSALRDV